ncbi:LptF/LptG family permease [Psychrobacter phenylpyruvicus]|uniref:Lipopolysaccharide export system permease protein lptG n=1 Tax=Psychrobacter phenylpyruvicus TaxID=29432 RepID=A0A379LPJ3_9GAMM|nr:LptF/LptG family permease [Psychrobacter phenylpyruvicus]SUD92025.1 Lipopolysaccharide export system permease protein lptG [Psychrobacter phenylpyruvicus]
MSFMKSGDSKTTLTGVKSGKIISRYVKKNALFAMLFAVIGLWALQIIFAYLAELEDISESYTYFDALTYIFYKSPYFLEQFTPTGALLGAVVGLGLLANNSELIVMRAAGLSINRIVSWVLQPAFIFVILALAINQYVLPESNLKANQIRKPDTALLASVNGYWTIQKAPAVGENAQQEGTGQNIIYIDYADANGNIGKVKRWHLDENNNLTAVSKASSGIYLPKANEQNQAGLKNLTQAEKELINYQWELEDVTTLKLAERAAITQAEEIVPKQAVSEAQNNPGSSKVLSSNVRQSQEIVLNNEPLVSKQNQADDVINLPISPSSVYLLTRRAEDLSLTQLYDHKRFNASQGTRSLEHEVAFWQKLLSPFAILSLVIVACSFVFGSLRTHSLGLRIVVALIFGLLFSYIQDLTSFVALATGASPLLMVLLPIIGSAALGFYLIKRQG